MNICCDCFAVTGHKEPDPLFSETGPCGVCGKVKDVYDLELVGLYVGLGLSPDFVWRELPRLRCYRDKTLSMEDIGRLIRQKVDANGHTDH